VKFKSHLYYEEKDRVTESLKALKVLRGSKLIFYKNGVCQDVAFCDIYGGHYFPTLSLHKSATVSVNFGPNFKYPPSETPFRGVSINKILCHGALLINTTYFSVR
jgi:Set1/Ash2 histone methyltransferase complex subunit ASH2